MSVSDPGISAPATMEQLAQLVEKADTHRAVLGQYQGAYSLGVTRLPSEDEQAALLLRVEPDEPQGFPNAVTLAGHQVPVIVRGGFRVPQPLRR